jgi:hypothetical protein
MTSNSEYAAPFGWQVKWVSGLVLALVIGCAIVEAVNLYPAPGYLRWTLACVPVAIVVLTIPFTVRGYALEGRHLLIRRLWWVTRIPLAGLQSATLDRAAMKGSWRCFGNGGLFGLTGWWRNKKYGVYRTFVTDPHRCVVLRYAERTIFISPDRGEDFIRQLQARMTECAGGVAGASGGARA